MLRGQHAFSAVGTGKRRRSRRTSSEFALLNRRANLAPLDAFDEQASADRAIASTVLSAAASNPRDRRPRRSMGGRSRSPDRRSRAGKLEESTVTRRPRCQGSFEWLEDRGALSGLVTEPRRFPPPWSVPGLLHRPRCQRPCARLRLFRGRAGTAIGGSPDDARRGATHRGQIAKLPELLIDR
jgi:hypothetical protein